jgi:hypothetical protein
MTRLGIHYSNFANAAAPSVVSAPVSKWLHNGQIKLEPNYFHTWLTKSVESYKAFCVFKDG